MKNVLFFVTLKALLSFLSSEPPKPPESGKRSRWDVSEAKEDKKSDDSVRELPSETRPDRASAPPASRSEVCGERNGSKKGGSDVSPSAAVFTQEEPAALRGSDTRTDDDEEKKDEEEEESRPPMDLFKAIFASSSDEEKSSSSSGESDDDDRKEEESQAADLFTVTSPAGDTSNPPTGSATAP